MISWISNGSTDGTLVTAPYPSHTAHVADRVVSSHVGLCFLDLSPGLISDVYMSLLAVVKLYLFIINIVIIIT